MRVFIVVATPVVAFAVGHRLLQPGNHLGYATTRASASYLSGRPRTSPEPLSALRERL